MLSPGDRVRITSELWEPTTAIVLDVFDATMYAAGFPAEVLAEWEVDFVVTMTTPEYTFAAVHCEGNAWRDMRGQSFELELVK